MNFLSKTSFQVLLICLGLGILSCKNQQKEAEPKKAAAEEQVRKDPFFKLSLAEWSLHRQIFDKKLDPMHFAKKANEMGFEGLEYVSAFYQDHYKNAENQEEAFQKMLDTLKAESDKYNIRNVLIMVDEEGDLAVSDETERNKAVENHKKWIDAAEYLGAHSIRVNLFGSPEAEEWKKNAADALKKLAEYAQPKGVNVLVENHGYLSSNAKLLTEVMEMVNMPNVGTLPDFGNFCLKREGGERWEAQCVEEYPRYKGVREMMPYAKAVSAKSYDFNKEGEETTIDYGRILEIVKEAGYGGFIGVEYEGDSLSEEKGIMATKELLIKEGSKLN
ncbi:sugar phosphate isomerase/epimerase family protein [Salegentibacter chungangensis]|uniref:Sugar phosphate isomerase/epimerase family protein n=1 Tax=Salegentibacter chungangensis TaxID=1335724 RepID=A0ABW3NTR5_9FLAO